MNGKLERSHLTDKREFYQLLEYTDDIYIGRDLKEWDLNGKTPYELLREKLKPQNIFHDPPLKKGRVGKKSIFVMFQSNFRSVHRIKN